MSKRSTSQKNEKPNITTLRVSPRVCWVLLGIVILFFSLIRVRLLNMPLERDEGEYAYAGQLILQGIPPYQLAYNMKLPGTYLTYAVIMAIFGQSPAGIHMGLLFTNAATVVLVFLLGERLFGPATGLIAGSAYTLLSTNEGVLGFAGHATHFVVLAAVGGILILLKAVDEKRAILYFSSGFLLGLAFVLKQPGLFFAFFGGFFLVLSEWLGARDWRGLARSAAAYCAGVALPFLLTCAVLFFAGALGKMWFWTFSYASRYAALTSLSEGRDNLFLFGWRAVEPAPALWILAAVGMAAIAWDSRTRRHGAFLISFLLFSCAAVCPGFYFRPHYFILVLPAICLLVGVAVTSAATELYRRFPNNRTVAGVPALVFLAIMMFSILGQSEDFFRLDPVAVCREIYGSSPFPEAQVISEYLRRQTAPDARIAVMGSEPEIYFYTRRHSATGYIYTYPLLEDQSYALDMQKEMAKEVESNHPEYLVIVNVTSSWMSPSQGSNTFIFDRMQKYADDNYDMVGVAADILPQTRYVWGDAAKSYQVHSSAFIHVLKRKNI